MSTSFESPSAALTVSDAAVRKIAELIADEGTPAPALRVYVTGGGCSGMQYGFAFEHTTDDGDLRVEHGGVSLLVDSLSLQYLQGASIDYEEGLEGSRFVINNPNATTTCGCGSSFAV